MIPYERQYTLVGTTDIPVTRDDFRAKITRKEIEYLCQAASRYADKADHAGHGRVELLGGAAAVRRWQRRSLAVTRDYHLLLDKGAWPDDPPLVSVFGGKITTYRKLAEQVMAKLAEKFPGQAGLDPYRSPARRRSARAQLPRPPPRLPPAASAAAEDLAGARAAPARLARRGDHRRRRGRARPRPQLRRRLYEREVDYLVKNEWAREADDVLWRRTKCGLHMSTSEKTAVHDYLAKH